MKKEKPKEYKKQSVARLMTEDVPTVPTSATVADIERLLIKDARHLATINYIYILDAHRKLKGVVSIRELFASPKAARALDFSPRQLVTVRPSTDRERAALLALKHSIKAVPVVDKEGAFLGVIPADAILNTLHTEAVEDTLRFAGSGTFDDPVAALMKEGAGLHVRKRLPWLVVGLLGGVAAAFVVSFFEGIFAEHLVLVAFIPAVVYMADAVGSQTQMIFIRTIGLSHSLNVRLYAWRETKINALLALTLGVLIALISFVWLGLPVVSLILGLSIVATVLISMSIAIALPWALHRFGYDPAIASGPPATVARDITSLIVYFVIAGLFIL